MPNMSEAFTFALFAAKYGGAYMLLPDGTWKARTDPGTISRLSSDAIANLRASGHAVAPSAVPWATNIVEPSTAVMATLLDAMRQGGFTS